MKLTVGLAVALTVVSGYATFASYKWWTASSRAQVVAMEEERAVLVDGIRYVREQQQAQVDAGNEARADVHRTFTQIKEVVREVAVDSLDSEFDPRVRVALCEAVTAANRELPTARDAPRGRCAAGERP